MNKGKIERPAVCVHNNCMFTIFERAGFMNGDKQYGLPNFDRPTEALLRQLVNAATARRSVPLRVIDYRPAGRSAADS